MTVLNTNPLTSLYYHITNRCNLRCRHCWVRAGTVNYKDELTLYEATGITKECKKLGLESVKLTGGEPFVVLWLMDFIGYLAEEGINVTIETNGTLITRRKASKLRGYGNVSQIAISLDGSSASSHEKMRGVPGCFAQTVSGIKNLVDVGIKPSLMVAVHKGNLHELRDIAFLVSSLGVRSIKLNCVHGRGRGSIMEATGETLDMVAQLELFDSLEDLEQEASVEFQIGIPLALKPLNKINRHRAFSCNITGTLGLLPNGDWAMCGIGVTNPDLNYGNFREHSAAEIWNSHPLIREIAESLPEKLEGVCCECIFKTVCRGGCRAEAYCQGGTVLAPHPMCQWAKDNGKFPISRLTSV